MIQLFVPPVILFFGAGYAFAEVCGFWPGVAAATTVSCIGASLGAMLAFLRSRYMTRDIVELFAQRYPIVKAADRAMQRNGLYVMLLLRLCPIVPFNGLNYIGGVTSISMEKYTKALIGIVPTVLLWSFVGASADEIGNQTANDPGEQAGMVFLLIVGVAFAMFGLVLLYRYAIEELIKEIAADRAASWHRYKKTSSAGGVETFRDEPSESMTDTERGLELLEKYPPGILTVLGIDQNAVETTHVNTAGDEEWFWVWA